MHNPIKRFVASDVMRDSLSENFSAGRWWFGSTLYSCIVRVLSPWRDHIHVATTSLSTYGIMEAGIRGSITSPYAAFFGKPLSWPKGFRVVSYI